MIRFLLVSMFSLSLLFAGCDDNDSDNDEGIDVDVDGMTAVQSSSSVDATVSSLQNALQANDAISIVETVNHSANAQNAGLTLRATQVILFGNPQLGTPLMQENQTAGIDLPQKFLVYQDENDSVIIGYNNPQYVANRHGISGQDEILNTISSALSGLAENAAGMPVQVNNDNDVEAGEGLISVQSDFSVDSTFLNLQAAINANDALTVMAELDHQANAANVDMELHPTRVLMFGNPNLGTPLMQSGQTIGIDLPQKVLIYEDANGDVFLVYNDPFYLADRHDIEDQGDVLDTISNALQNLATAATSSQ